MTHLSISRCCYMRWYLQRVKLLLAWQRSQHCADRDNDWRDWYVTLKTKISSSHILHLLIPSSRQKHKQNYLSWSSATMSSTTFSNHFMGGYRNSECHTSTWNFNIHWYTKSKNLNTCFTALTRTISATSTHSETFIYTNIKEEFFYMATYIPSMIVVLSQPAQRHSTVLIATQHRIPL